MTKATIEIPDLAYKAILKEQYERKSEGEKITIAQIASEMLDRYVRSVSGDTVKAK